MSDAIGAGLGHATTPSPAASTTVTAAVGRNGSSVLQDGAMKPPGTKLRIFLSYGHDEFRELAVKLDHDLRARGHDVWFDDDRLVPSRVWEYEIAKGISWASQDLSTGWFLLLMTPHSVRARDGYCLNELEAALDKHLPVLPIMAIKVPVPLSINRLQYLDMTSCLPVAENPAAYQRQLDRLCAALEGRAELATEGEENRLRRAMKPVSYEYDTTYRLPRFTGRQWVFGALDNWLANPDGAQVFWIVGPPGSGKSAIAAWLYRRRTAVKAFHVCNRYDRRKTDPRQVVRAIAWQIASQLEEVFQRLTAIDDMESICRDEPVETLFDRLIVQPAHGLVTPPQPFIILIDGLDEATDAGTNPLAELLAAELSHLPPWMRAVLTSSPESEVTVPLQAWTPFELRCESAENLEDATNYIRAHIAPLAPRSVLDAAAIQRLLALSEGNWLYLEWLRQALAGGSLTLANMDAFPRALGGAYQAIFSRRFPDSAEYRKLHRRCLELVASAYEPLHVSDLARILGCTDAEAQDVVRDFGALLSVTAGVVRPFHHTLCTWASDQALSGDHSVCQADGHRALARDGWTQYEKGVCTMSDYALRYLASHLEATGETARLVQLITDARVIAGIFAVEGLDDLARFWKSVEPSRLVELCRKSFAQLSRDRTQAKVIYDAALGTGQLFQQAGMYEAAISYFRAALRLASRREDIGAIGVAHYNIGWCLRHAERHDEALKHLSASIESLRATGNRDGVARALSAAGLCQWHKQHDRAALQQLNESLAIYKEIRDERHEAEALNHLGIVRRSLGLYDEALSNLSDSASLSSKYKDRKALGKCLNSMGTAFWWKGDRGRAIECYKQANQLNEQLNQPYLLGLTANNLGYVNLEMGQYTRAYDAFARARDIRRTLHLEDYEMMDVSGMALASYRLQNTAEAKRLSRRAIAALGKYDSVEDLPRAYFNHYLILRCGTYRERQEGSRALRKAQSLVNERIAKLEDDTLLSTFKTQVPLVRDILGCTPTRCSRRPRRVAAARRRRRGSHDATR